MVSTSKLAALIVTVVIIAPVLVGFAMPSGMETNVGYETQRTTNITGDISSDNIPNYAPYSGILNQNPLLYLDGSLSTTANPVGQTGSPNPLGAWSTATDGTLEIAAGAYVPPMDGYDMRFIHADTPIFRSGDYIFEGLLVYPNSIYGYNTTTTPMGYTLLTGPVTAMAATTADVQSVRYGLALTPDEDVPAYMDISLGYWVPTVESIWSNTHLNQRVEIILHSSVNVNNTVELVLGGRDVSVEWSNRVITATVAGTTATIGTWYAYPYIGVIYDALNDEISVVGMSGMSGFLDAPSATRSNALTVSADLDPIRTFSILDTTDNQVWSSFLVTSASVQASTMMGIRNATVNPSDYYPDNLWQISIQSPAVYGDSITLGNRTYDVTRDGIIHDVELLRGSEMVSTDLSVRGLTIASFPNLTDGGNDILVNGFYWGNVQSLPIGFEGDWLFTLLISDLDSYSYTSYVWDTGSFNLDVVGFCMVGLMASFGAFIAAALVGRRSGTKAAILLLVSGICAGVYIVIMEGAL